MAGIFKCSGPVKRRDGGGESLGFGNQWYLCGVARVGRWLWMAIMWLSLDDHGYTTHIGELQDSCSSSYYCFFLLGLHAEFAGGKCTSTSLQ